MNRTYIAIAVGACLLIGVGAFFLWSGKDKEVPPPGPGEVPKSLLMGTWQSTSSSTKYTREFNENGTFIDRYDSRPGVEIRGTWKIVNALMEPDLPIPAAGVSAMTVFKFTFESGEVMFFGANALTTDTLRLRNLSGKSTIVTYKKIK